MSIINNASRSICRYLCKATAKHAHQAIKTTKDTGYCISRTYLYTGTRVNDIYRGAKVIELGEGNRLRKVLGPDSLIVCLPKGSLAGGDTGMIGLIPSKAADSVIFSPKEYCLPKEFGRFVRNMKEAAKTVDFAKFSPEEFREFVKKMKEAAKIQ